MFRQWARHAHDVQCRLATWQAQAGERARGCRSEQVDRREQSQQREGEGDGGVGAGGTGRAAEGAA